MERWERRARKIEKRRKEMKVSGKGLITVIQPIIVRKAEEAKRAGKRKSPARSAA